MIEVEVFACRHCRALAVCIDDIRITNHKCAGQWEVLMKETVDWQSLVDFYPAIERLTQFAKRRLNPAGPIRPKGSA
jgi:hypothetical protein